MNAPNIEVIPPQPKEPCDPRRRRLPPTIGLLLRWGFFALLAIGVVLSLILGLVQKWLWMRQLDFAGIFWTLFSVKWGIFCVTLFISIVYLWINLRFAARNIDTAQGPSFFSKEFTHPADPSRTINIDVSSKLLVSFIDAAILILSVLFALSVSSQWDTFLRFRFGGSFGVADPLFGVDLGFYVFRLPFYELVQGGITLLTVSAIAILAFCALFGMRQSKSTGKITVREGIAQHFSVLLFILVANFGWGFFLDHYELVYSTLGVVYGAGYAAAHVTKMRSVGHGRRLGLWHVCFSRLRLFRPRIKSLAAGIAAYAILYVAGVLVLPNLFQAFIVRPSELSLETPYLKNYIDFTRKAYKLDGIQETAYPALSRISLPEVIARNQDTIQNIRLWDSRPLLQTYQQTQAIRLYYQFYNVNAIDTIWQTAIHQVMLSSRELASQLPAAGANMGQ